MVRAGIGQGGNAWKCGLLPADSMSRAEHSAQDTRHSGLDAETLGALKGLKCEAIVERLDTDCI